MFNLNTSDKIINAKVIGYVRYKGVVIAASDTEKTVVHFSDIMSAYVHNEHANKVFPFASVIPFIQRQDADGNITYSSKQLYGSFYQIINCYNLTQGDVVNAYISNFDKHIAFLAITPNLVSILEKKDLIDAGYDIGDEVHVKINKIDFNKQLIKIRPAFEEDVTVKDMPDVFDFSEHMKRIENLAEDYTNETLRYTCADDTGEADAIGYEEYNTYQIPAINNGTSPFAVRETDSYLLKPATFASIQAVRFEISQKYIDADDIRVLLNAVNTLCFFTSLQFKHYITISGDNKKLNSKYDNLLERAEKLNIIESRRTSLTNMKVYSAGKNAFPFWNEEKRARMLNPAKNDTTVSWKIKRILAQNQFALRTLSIIGGNPTQHIVHETGLEQGRRVPMRINTDSMIYVTEAFRNLDLTMHNEDQGDMVSYITTKLARYKEAFQQENDFFDGKSAQLVFIAENEEMKSFICQRCEDIHLTSLIDVRVYTDIECMSLSEAQITEGFNDVYRALCNRFTPSRFLKRILGRSS